MPRRHLSLLCRLSLLGIALQCRSALAEDPLTTSLAATNDPAITADDLITNSLPPDVAPASYLDPRQIFEDIERDAGVGGNIDPISTPVFTSTPTAIPTSELEGIGSSFDAGENRFLQTTDPALALQQSNTARGVNAQRRSALAFDPRVRSYGLGQLYTQADGVLMLPVRPDLSTILSAVDPWLIQNIDVVKGPYGLRYGPGFAFVDVTTMATPRYTECAEAHARTGYSYMANGKRHYARETVYGGSDNYGYIFGFGYRNGAEYDAGGNTTPDIPGAYKANNVLAQFGFDLTADARLEMRYQHLETSNTVYPGQFFNLDGLTTDIYDVAYIEEDAGHPWTRLFVNGWYYRTPLRGRVENDAYFQVQERVESALDARGGPFNNNVTFNGTTSARLGAAGGKVVFTFGEDGDSQLLAGIDMRYLRQNVNEDYFITDGFTTTTLHSQVPNSESTNPGAFLDLSAPLLDAWTARIGGRIDYVYTTTGDVQPGTMLPAGLNDLSQGDALYSFYQMNDLELTSNWTLTFGAGQAQRAPSLIQRYAEGVFIGVVQDGFSRIVGDQNLEFERVWQGDISLTADYEYTRGQVGVFYAVVDDYIGFRSAEAADPTGARLLRYINIPQATLMGFEAYGEQDLSETWTAFAAGQFVYGEDNGISAPLPGIPPLDTRVGVRVHDADAGKFWNVEMAGRIVAPQDRLGVVRVGDLTTVGTTTLESRTSGFFTIDLRGYWTPRGNDSLTWTGGILNLTDTRYVEHLDVRLPAVNGFNAAFAYAPGITPYLGVEWNY